MNQWIFLVDGINMREGDPNYFQFKKPTRRNSNVSHKNKTMQHANSALRIGFGTEGLEKTLTKQNSASLKDLFIPKLDRKARRNKSTTDMSAFNASNNAQSSFNTMIVKYVGDQKFSFNNVEVAQDGTDEKQLENYWTKDQSDTNLTMKDQLRSEIHNNIGDISFGMGSGSQNEDRIERVSQYSKSQNQEGQSSLFKIMTHNTNDSMEREETAAEN